MLSREKIIVLRKMPFLESDLLIWGLNQKGSQMSFIAKGALKSKKRFKGGVLDPCSYIGLEYRPSQKSLHRLQQAWFLDDFPKLRTSYQRLSLALYFLKVLLKVSQEGEDFKELFHLLGNALKEAETSPQLDNLKLFFQIKILFLQGVLEKEFYLTDILSKHLKDHAEFSIDSMEKTSLQSKLNNSLSNYLEVSL